MTNLRRRRPHQGNLRKPLRTNLALRRRQKLWLACFLRATTLHPAQNQPNICHDLQVWLLMIMTFIWT
ncbi:hypothetical protein L596_005820 [Steinernema carpocapsae]|uniref:Uncharacterized protein n=1 Tax=Steinernema carpocapsae TaxID=34508 RepID=A0A4U8V0C6_STECR|nr:hypothetical protein L596_005820 [Steinernema carpocapsae]